MADEELGKEIWFASEADERRVGSSNESPAQFKGDKTKELGIFAIGLGVIIALLSIFAAVVLQPSGATVSVSRLAVVLSPSLVFVLAGIAVLLIRSSLSVDVARWVVTLAFLGQALLTMNLFNWAFSIVCVCLVWRTANQAIEQLNGNRQAVEQ